MILAYIRFVIQKAKMRNILLKTAIFLALLLAALPGSAQPTAEKKQAELDNLIRQSEVFSKMFTGFALYDPDSRKMLYEKDADKYYTPASNTKILTLYTVLKVLGDSIPALRYIEAGDSLVFWGTGNPLLRYPRLPEADSSAWLMLRDSPRRLFFSAHNFLDERFGPGWAWDDYNDYYQAEKSPFPLYGNLARFERVQLEEGFRAFPPHFQHHLAFNAALDNRRPRIRRAEHTNIFEYNHRALSGLPFAAEVPFRTAPSMVAELLSDTLGHPVGLVNLEDLPPQVAKTLSLALPDTLLRLLMYDSDNFIAEQLLLACAEKIAGILSAEEAIRYASDSLLSGLPDKLVWRDGSGLSRYNLFTPRSLAGVLELLYRELPRERLLSLFPAGGRSGTIKDLYGHREGPFVFAKTGTLANRHCLSGYLLTKQGKVLIFSFMHNNFVNGTGPVKEEMDKVLRWIRGAY
jgi:serine-type D-Ala-D-Ala carboxypeptidase/endopeptidase (penicillin-binding protein 4)